MNNCIFIGRLTADPELKTAQSGTAICRFSIAVDRRKRDEGADFLRCVAFGKTAETITKYMKKGRRIGLETHVQTGSYDDKEGRKVYTTDFIVDSFDFCDSANAVQEAAPAPAPAPKPRQSRPVQTTFDSFLDIPDGIDEELPFK